jgi:Domain of unknown function (DUF4160)
MRAGVRQARGCTKRKNFDLNRSASSVRRWLCWDFPSSRISVNRYNPGQCSMPTISTFFGVAIRMYYDDHAPPHFHAYYGEDAVVVEIGSLLIRDGRLPKRAMAMVLEWAAEHRSELSQNWALAEAHQPLNAIQPLE